MIARLTALLLLFIIGAAVAADYHSAPGPAVAIGAGEAAGQGASTDDDAPSVAKVCGFAPCGMPLPCD